MRLIAHTPHSLMPNPTPNRRLIRLKGYDYTQPGAYFVTIVTALREPLFGEIVDGEMRLNAAGRIVLEEWQRTPTVRPEMDIDAFVVMPNHVHGIVIIREIDDIPYGGAHGVGAHGRAPQSRAHNGVGACHAPLQRNPRSLGSFIAGYKSIVTRRVNTHFGTPSAPLWQRNFFERIIRNDQEWDRARRYIESNPLNWDLDQEHPGQQAAET